MSVIQKRKLLGFLRNIDWFGFIVVVVDIGIFWILYWAVSQLPVQNALAMIVGALYLIYRKIPDRRDV